MNKILLIAALLLGGCASTPNTLILAPDAPMVASHSPQGQLRMETVDHRSEQYLVEIRSGDGAAQLLSPAEPPRQLLDKGVRNALTRMGFDIDPAASTQMTLSLDRLVMEVNQTTFKHDANSQLDATVFIDNNGRQLTKRFTVRSNFNGPLKPDMSRIEREMNDRLTQLMTDIVTDAEVQQYLQ
ncbi:uncharacterized lipoprotein [Ferrimonas sediminum]|uniref:Uncharacterized lipoprotein n=1 Tax=Ferrimonas sediminum TaxID=718193 RepID=A0A1G8LT01_9GAMM|nr:YajG family lipoprotein [Ferrimonas sediminum]SDI58832.1 uncharacterized lipoprotein [Ferrimonas sediminum]